MTAYGTTAFASPAPSFSATASGTTNNVTTMVNVNIGDADLGRNGNIYLGFYFQQTWYFHNGAGWVPFNGGALPLACDRRGRSQRIAVALVKLKVLPLPG